MPMGRRNTASTFMSKTKTLKTFRPPSYLLKVKHLNLLSTWKWLPHQRFELEFLTVERLVFWLLFKVTLFLHLLKMYCCIKLESRKFGICCLERNWISEEKAKGRKKCIKWILFFCLLSAHILIETKCRMNKNWDFGPKTFKSIFTEKLILETDESKPSQSLLCNNLQESQKSFLLKKIYWKEKAFLDFQFWVFLF